MMRVVVLASGKGSNFQALLNEAKNSTSLFHVAGLVSDKPDCYAVQIAKDENIPIQLVRPKDYENRSQWNLALADAVMTLSADLVVLAGFMRILGTDFLARHGHTTINIHPSLLPSFPGLDAQQQAIDAGVRVSGATVHLVDSGVDTGPILAQAAVPVMPNDDADTLHQRIQEIEHPLLCSVVKHIASGHIRLNPLSLDLHQLQQPSTYLFSPALR